MSAITLTVGNRKYHGRVKLPLSKSISNRALIISALSHGKVDHGELSEADDTRLLADLLFKSVSGKENKLNAANAGTVFRFLTAYLAIQEGEWILEGDERMCNRPIDPLVDALRHLGAEIEYLKKQGFPPLKITGKDLKGGVVNVSTQVSSQFISALMMVGPMMPEGLQIIMREIPGSWPYISLTEELMLKAGAKVVIEYPSIFITGSGYGSAVLPHEPDWSAAAFWYEVIALSWGNSITIEGLNENSPQGDAMAERYFRLLEVETIYKQGAAHLYRFLMPGTNFEIDLRDHPDLAPSLIVAVAAKGKKGVFSGLRSLRHKESDRLQALANELQKTGIHCEITDDSLSFESQAMEITQPFETYGDHRLAMAFAPLALLENPVTINNPEVVSKSYPGFWDEIRKVLSVEG